MFNLPPSVRLFLATRVIDGRKGPDSLMTLVRDVLGEDIFDGHLFIFFTRRRDRVRIVYWDAGAFVSSRPGTKLSRCAPSKRLIWD